MRLHPLRLFQRFQLSEKGNVAVIFGLSAMALLGLTGGALDYYSAVSLKGKMQDAMDASVLAGLRYAEAERQDEAAKVFHSNLPENVSGIIPVYTPTPDENSLTGRASFASPTTLLNLLGIRDIPLSVTATARGTPVKDNSHPCVYVLNPNGQNSLTLNSGPNIDAPECSFQVHSTANPAITLNQGLNVNINKLCVAGGHILDNNRNFKPLELNCPVESDPYGPHLPEVKTTGGCTSQNIDGASATLTPGTYCNVNFNGQPKITLEPGLYIIDGSWNVNGGSWTGKDVTFYFPNKNALIQFNSSVNVNLSAPESGPYKGVLMFEKPGLGISNFIFNDSPSTRLEGLIWLPSRNITFNGGSSLTSHNFTLVSWTLMLNQTRWNLSPYTKLDPKPQTANGSGLTNIRLTR